MTKIVETKEIFNSKFMERYLEGISKERGSFSVLVLGKLAITTGVGLICRDCKHWF